MKMRPLMKKKGKECAVNEDGKETYEIVEDTGPENKEMGTHIRFEISAGDYGNDAEGDRERPASRMSGIIRAATSEGARLALGTILSMILARGKDEDDER
ncbi:MAG: hypothetical protein LBH69_01475 [Methanomassiliicoccaceae archaeon]|jgi:hypothetical protein|nr:hypothetical protein [Methanomassiliicoccaceae archaeon]